MIPEISAVELLVVLAAVYLSTALALSSSSELPDDALSSGGDPMDPGSDANPPPVVSALEKMQRHYPDRRPFPRRPPERSPPPRFEGHRFELGSGDAR